MTTTMTTTTTTTAKAAAVAVVVAAAQRHCRHHRRRRLRLLLRFLSHDPRQARRSRSLSRAQQRFAINYDFWQKLDAPPEADWGGKNGSVALCMRALGIPKGSNGTVRKVFALTTGAAEKDEVYDPSSHRVTNARRGRPPLLATNGPEAPPRVTSTLRAAGLRLASTGLASWP
jgi:hypothetical protein